MISFEHFTMEDGVPIYLQILRYIKREAVAGVIRDGDELPSRRVLSTRLAVNPNTVQKAYRMLEDEDLIVSHAGAASVMKLDEEKLAALRTELVEEDAMGAIRAWQQMGLTKGEVLALIEKLWE
ncbi:MAG: GntR family transcriptional regulator [Ruminococcaceae bacterium]|nr:GntR family transcriptional regulator [Oscillospiraceae bacterium]